MNSESCNAMKNSHKKLEKTLVAIARSSIKRMDNGNSPSFKTIHIDDIIGQVFGSGEIYASLKHTLETLPERIQGTEIKWVKGGGSCKVKFSNPKAFLKSVGIITDEEKLSKTKELLSFCNTEKSIFFRESLKEKNCSSDKKINEVLMAAKFLNYVTAEDYQTADIRTVSAAIYTKKDGSKVLEDHKGIIRRTIKEVTKFDDNILDSIFKFNSFENPLYVYANINISTDVINVNGVLQPYFPLLPSLIDNVIVSCRSIITIENKTTFHLWVEQENLIKRDDICVIYTGGFAGSSVIMLLRGIIEQNKIKSINHFGDIDNGGFEIMHDIENKTGVPANPIVWTPELIKKHGAYFDYDGREPKNYIEEYAINNKLRVEQEKIGSNMLKDIILNIRKKLH